MRKKRRFYIFIFLLLLLALTLITKRDNNNPHQKGARNPGLLLTAGVNSFVQNYKPALIYIDPNNNFSLKNIDLAGFNFDFTGIHEARPIFINNEYKIALGAYSNEDYAKQTEFIILNNGSFGFDSLEIEFKEQVNDARIRAVFVGDIDNDGKEEIIIGTRPNGILRYYKFIDNHWVGSDIDFREETIHDILIADINRNGINEILITTSPRVGVSKFSIPYQPLDSTGKIISYELNPDTNTWQKEIVWEYIFPLQSLSGKNFPKHARYLFASDIDGDGSKEIVANVLGLNTNNIELFRWGELNYSREIIEDSLNIHNSAIIVDDIDADGRDEIFTFTQIDTVALLYNYNDETWGRETVANNLINKDNAIYSLYTIGSAENSYKKILYTVSSILNTEASLVDTALFYLERINNVWENRYIGTTNQPLVVWGIFPASPD